MPFSIHFPDPNDPNMRKSTVTITGSIEAAVTAKVYLLVRNIPPYIVTISIKDCCKSQRTFFSNQSQVFILFSLN